MRTDKKMRRYLEKTNSNIVKNYKEMCKILREEEKTKAEKELQLEQWKGYFDFEIKGQKFIIKKIYTELLINKNMRMYTEKQKELEIENSISNLMIHKEYREFFFPVLFYMLKKKTENTLLDAKVEFAQMCGFFNKSIKGKSIFDNYITYKEVRKSEFPEKAYWNLNMEESNYVQYLLYIKNSVFGIIERALNALQNMNVLEFSEVKVGIEFRKNIKSIYELSSEENEKYEKLDKEALKEVLPLYNKKTKRKRKSIKEKDLIPYPSLLRLYYQKRNALVVSKLKYDSVANYYKVKLTDLNSRVLEELDIIKSDEQLKDFQRKLNSRYSNNLQINALKNYRKKSEQNKNLTEVENCEDKEPTEKIEYYNKTEIIDQLVSFEPVFDVINE